MVEPTPQRILSINSESSETDKSQTGWTIFWLVVFTPLGWYFVWRKATWPTWVKVSVIISTVVVLSALLLEAELIASQIAASLLTIPQ